MGTLWCGGTIYTMESEGKTVNAVFVEDGVIVKTGTKQSLLNQFNDKIERTIDLKGNVMYPGFVDSHMHIIGHGEKLLRLDLSEVKSAENMKELLVEKVKTAGVGEWIIGEGWNENNFSDRKIFHRKELDEIAPNHPMMLTRVCRHAILANSRALELARITKETPDPEGGVILRNEIGEPTGYLLDRAQELIKKVMPPVTNSYVERALTTAVDDLVSLGLVGGHTEDLNYYNGFENTFQTFTKVIDGKKRKFRTNLLVHHEVVKTMHEAGLHVNDGTSFISLGAMKIFADGALGGRTALLSHPYNDSPETSGVAIHSIEELKALVEKARHYNMPVAIHTIGDLALEYALDAIEQAPVRAGYRDRLIHCSVVREDLLIRMRNLPVVLDIQPHFVAADFPWVIERLGEERMKWSFAWKTLLNYGLLCAGGSDAPIEPANPLLGIYTAAARKKPTELHEGYYPEQKLTVYEAVKLFTIGSAHAVGQEAKSGIIAAGYNADFTILKQDLYKISIEEIPKAEVAMTVVDGTIVYQKDESARTNNSSF
ncbi:amidohydrolase [Bacillus taeanensis]|uniref:Amidohydrolase n=1 Tax=Bacillus taeanensis TaxID=273032 RepID=A0A366XYH0_9BACI|nr:amidohydrolase [Bacillus taeanensis]RBW71460.1 amidohydrolase [Bacillus taeanensis]